MAETIGWLCDKIIISELKIFHTIEQIEREDASKSHCELCRARLNVLERQRDDLQGELSLLFKNVIAGKVKPKVYRQFKMYNYPRFLDPNSKEISRRG